LSEHVDLKEEGSSATSSTWLIKPLTKSRRLHFEVQAWNELFHHNQRSTTRRAQFARKRGVGNIQRAFSTRNAWCIMVKI